MQVIQNKAFLIRIIVFPFSIFRRDLLAIDIFFQDLYCNVIEQVPQLELQSLLGRKTSHT